MSQLGNALFTSTQQKVLGLLYGRPDRSFYLKEILRLTGMGVATIKRELDRMRTAGILTMTRVGNQHHYQANPDCPIHHELATIVRKTFGAADTIKAALLPLDDRIEHAFIFGSTASGKEASASDIDLMVVGDVDFSEVVNRLYPVQEILGREINPKIYRKDELRRMQQAGDGFLKEVMAKPRIEIIGAADESG